MTALTPDAFPKTILLRVACSRFAVQIWMTAVGAERKLDVSIGGFRFAPQQPFAAASGIGRVGVEMGHSRSARL